MIKPQEWADWLNHPVTETVLQYLNTRKDALIEQHLNIDIGKHASIESYGLECLATRCVVEGLGEVLDLQNLQESLVGVTHEN